MWRASLCGITWGFRMRSLQLATDASRRQLKKQGPIGNEKAPYKAYQKSNACYYWPTAPAEFEVKNPGLMIWWNNTQMSEDCLYLNIWTPTTDDSAAKAVMVWIFGGGFFGGSSNLEIYDGEVLSSKTDVVVVSMQYRTGPLGFLHLDDEEAPGNMGLLDQLLAIKWIKENIQYFGGDSSRITLFGESAGAASVSFHLLSPLSQDYFYQGIMDSGTAFGWWAVDNRTLAKQKAFMLAEQTGCRVDHNNIAAVANCLRQVDVNRIQTKSGNILNIHNSQREQLYMKISGQKTLPKTGDMYMYLDIPFKPVYGTNFLPYTPEKIIADGNFKKTNLLMGTVKNEGMFWLVYAMQAHFMPANNGVWSLPFFWSKPLKPDEKEMVARFPILKNLADQFLDPADIVYKYLLTAENMDHTLASSIIFEYNVPSALHGYKRWTAKDIIYALDNLTGDHSFKCSVINFAEAYLESSTNSNLWMFSFDRHTENLTMPAWTGAMHGYEVDYIFGAPFNKRFTKQFYGYTKEEQILSDDMMRFWSNFAKTGNPNSVDIPGSNAKDNSWPKYVLGNKSHIVLDVKKDVYETGQNLRRRQCKFWKHQLSNIRKTLWKPVDLSIDNNAKLSATKYSISTKTPNVLLLLAVLFLTLCFTQ